MKFSDIFELAITDISSRWIYSLLIIFMLLIGISSAFIAISQSQGIVSKEEQLFEFLRPNLLIVYPKSPISNSQVSVAKSMKYVSQVYPVINQTIEVEVNAQNYTFYLLGIDNLSIITSYTLVAGTTFDYSGLVIPSSSSIHISPGTLVKVYVNKDAKYTYISGVISYSHTVFQRIGVSSSTLFPSYNCLFTSLQYAEKLTGDKNYTFLIILTQSPLYNSNVTSEILSVFPNATVKSLGVSSTAIARQYASFTVYLVSLSIIAILTSIITNGSITSISFNRRLKEIGVMMALGMKRSHIALLYLLESFILGAVGGIAGLIVGYYITENIMLTKTVTYTPVYYPIQLVELVILSLLASNIGSIYPIFRVFKLTPSEVMR
ncbi:ABC transporter permease [Sulfurisphaera ohwakuensis]|uniref:ABC-type antimicrobial peptide transport system permease subunit n=1 Tax=Sulfurisphaera ohwakuensis TaxID=69656 RepID=A0A650CDY3_SULOH|nr:FtsX-like permease family protein [Sulfurisphaera ohwakuensis]MBB5253086.1 ABC-type antimicrobial peptide transport system permease subunit [Sulfurisphaera ohwakuensis]QGR15992.1 FtsX-like permease family protein [Sulfurisphaera ohwakuensis]